MKLLRYRDVPDEKYTNAFMGFGDEKAGSSIPLSYVNTCCILTTGVQCRPTLHWSSPTTMVKLLVVCTLLVAFRVSQINKVLCRQGKL